MNWILSVFSPMCLHFAVSEFVAILLLNQLGSAMCTALTALLVLPAAAWMYRKDRGYCADIISHCGIETQQRRRVMIGALCFLGGGLMNFAWSGLLNLLRIRSYFSNEVQEALFAGQLPVQIIGLGILVPVSEELIFRALTYNRMKLKLTAGKSVFFSAALFALYHGNPIQCIYAFPMALLLACIYEYGGSLAYPVLFHMGANLLAILLQAM